MKNWSKALSFLFPPTCGICNKIGKTYICASCKQQLETEKIYIPTIKKCNENVILCYPFLYTGIIRKKILQYKFRNKPYLANLFTEIFIKNEKICGFLQKYDIIIPVPMSKKKISQRGYNQTEIIAKKIAKQIQNISFSNQTLVKIKENNTQSTLNRKQRLENVKGVYKIKNELKIKEKNVLLFDDIYTTGATSKECTKVIKKAGAKEVGILVIAKDILK